MRGATYQEVVDLIGDHLVVVVLPLNYPRAEYRIASPSLVPYANIDRGFRIGVDQNQLRESSRYSAIVIPKFAELRCWRPSEDWMRSTPRPGP